MVALLAVTAAASTNLLYGLLNSGENGSSVSNLSTGMGHFVYTEEGIYYGVPGFIHLCDLQGNILKTYPLSDAQETPHCMFATEDAIIYINSGGLKPESTVETTPQQCWELRMQPKDGSSAISICPGVTAASSYADGDRLYVKTGIGTLIRIDLATLEQTILMERVNAFFVDEDYVYAVLEGTDHSYYKSPKHSVDFTKIEISFDPNKIIVDGNDIYLCQWMSKEDQTQTGKRYRVNLVRDREATALPVYSWYYQILNGSILYIEEGTNLLKSYNVSTGNTRTLVENVFEFSVLNGQYVCIERLNEESAIYDWENDIFSPIILG